MKKLTQILLVILAIFSMLFTLTACEEKYTAKETDALIAELQANIDANKNELDAKINTLITEYQAKDNEILAKISQNEQALATLKTNYDLALKDLQDKDLATEQAIADLDAKYLEEVEKLNDSIDSLTTQLQTNKTELENKINGVKAVYDAKFSEIESIITTLQQTDSSQQEVVLALVDRVTQLEKGMQISEIEIAENGDITISFVDGTSQTIEKPQGHEHTFGDMIVFGNDDNTCENKIFYCVCSGCNEVKFMHGTYNDHDFDTQIIEPTCQSQGYDHKICKTCGKEEKVNYVAKSDHRWQTKYTTDNSFHWIKCNDCVATKDKAEHSIDDSGYCTICNAVVGSTAGLIYELSANGTYAEVIGYEGSAKNVIIAKEYNGKPVKSIYKEAFYSSSIKSIVIPDSVTSIGDSAFYSCTSLTSVTIGNSVTSIGDHAFRSCDSLTSVTIGNSLSSIGDYAFVHCTSLTSVTIGNSVTSIGRYAFFDCNSLTSVTIPDSVTSIGGAAFSSCDSLTSIKYCGSEDQWNSIVKSSSWASGTGAYTIIYNYAG